MIAEISAIDMFTLPPAAKPKVKLPDCAFCDHPESDHCKGKSNHTTYKDQMRQSPKPATFKCKGRHCQSAICCCLEYIPKEKP